MKSWHDYKPPDGDLFPERYNVEEMLNESAASMVLLGYDTQSAIQVVIKCFKPSAKGAYLREINAAFDLSHPNVQRCLDTFHRADGMACIVYDYLEGGSLAQLLAEQGKLDLKTTILCLQAILTALAYLHRLNRIHCDIKPENIMLRPQAQGPADFVLIDLGAVCMLREAQEGQHVQGTPAYIAPERIKNRFFFNSDLYSLGVIAFEMACGRRPFVGTVKEITQANLASVPSLSGIQPTGLRDFIDHLLVKDPQQRLQSAEAALALLNKILICPSQWQTAVLTPVSIHARWRLQLEEEPVAIDCFHINGYPLIGLMYEGYETLIDPQQPQQPLWRFLTPYPLQILGVDRLAYATPSRVQIVELTKEGGSAEWLLKECLNDLKTWHVGYSKLVWSNTFFYYYDKLRQEPAAIRFGVSNYLLKPQVHILSDGCIVTSEGLANNKVVFRDPNTKMLSEWQLEGMVISLSYDNHNILVVTLNLNDSNVYSLWCLAIHHPPRKLVLTGTISHIFAINGVAFWVSDRTGLYCCDTTLRPQSISTLPSQALKIAATYDHRFIVALCKDDHGLFMTLLKNRAVL
ncbi:serine/threonine protein kinase [Methylovulum psychrotolerans]|uniref:Serine/threonine protein kinase n=1 Tax=Methylovulum psychrotolerans TaxID=1704499 RepID=A0A2S5CRX0_9GAMM|nr:serine/threonine-protein kinase [Methylovulum psychrotolerans]POZ53554.1 serine/threonine protein kinase [Methylovulum psychrotolerans]